jgi:hypothetical protein
MIAELERRGLRYILTAALRSPVRTLCRHDDAAWTPTEVKGIELQDVFHDGVRLVVLRQKVAERPQAGGKQLLEVPGSCVAVRFGRPRPPVILPSVPTTCASVSSDGSVSPSAPS